MSAISSIEWTDRTWNPVRGCSIVSPGCVNCYAMKFAHRFSGKRKPYEGLTKQTSAGPQWTGEIRQVKSALLEPLSWKKPARVFVNSMSDLFHEGISKGYIATLFAVMRGAPHLTFQVLTKRAERMREILTDPQFQVVMDDQSERLCAENGWCHLHDDASWPLKNVWLGVSCENQEQADKRIPLLLQTPAAVRFVSAEPLLNPISFEQFTEEAGDAYGDGAIYFNALSGARWMRDGFEKELTDSPRLDWVIVGGESGPGARPCAIRSIESIVDQCRSASVPVFVKQLGAHPYRCRQRDDGKVIHAYDEQIRLKDRKGGDPSEWFKYLQVRQFPATEARP